MKSAVIIFPGTNRERDMVLALAAAGARPVEVWHRETHLPAVDLIVIPGGFSYGDYLRAGCMAGHSPIISEVKKQAEAGVHVLGVCNGFQVLTETGLLPGALLRNAKLKFICKDVHLKVENNGTPFLSGYETGAVMSVPVAHHDGNYHAHNDVIKKLEDQNQIVLRYKENPNGSKNNIAGIVSDNGRIVGMMPHPERSVDPRFTSNDGKRFFTSIEKTFAG